MRRTSGMVRLVSKLRRLLHLSNSTRVPSSMTDPAPSAATAVLRSPVPVIPINDYPQNAPLENLPSELRDRIVSILELGELSALVHASPIFHQDYRRNRKLLLCKCLETTLHSVTVDACAAYRTGSADFADSRTHHTVTQFLQSYEDRRSATQYSIRTEGLTEDEAIGMAAFHSSIIQPLTRCYINWALANLAKEIGYPGSQYQTLSKTESIRILRALYRFQLSCNLFGKGRYGNARQGRLDFDSIEILTDFLDKFEPWEVEEIACIYTFAKGKYDQIFSDIRWDVDEKNPKFEGQRPPTPEGAFDLDNFSIWFDLMNGTISRGLELLHTVFTIKDHAHLVSTMQQEISWPATDFLEGAIDEWAQFERRQRYPSDRDRKQERRDPLPFKEDCEQDGVGGPPLAWTQIWGRTYCNLYGYYLVDAPRLWGYVFWDAVRLEHTGGKDVLERQWKAAWGEGDPRDNIF